MAIIPASQYPGQTTPASTSYPYGSARDVSSPGAGDGTPVQQAWVNDIFGFLQAILGSAGVTPNGNPDTAVASQYLDSLKALTTGRLIKNPTRFTSSGTFTPDPKTKRLIFEIIGGGAGGSSTTSSVSYQVGGGGGGGGYFKGTMTTIPSSVAVTVGSGGAADSAGGATTFGSYAAAGGGIPGNINAVSDPNVGTTAGGGNGGAFSFDSVNVVQLNASRGNPGGMGVVCGTVATSGNGGGGPFGGGGVGVSTSSNSVGNDGAQHGGGGSGSVKRVANSDSNIGGVGAAGYCIVYEYN